MSYTTRLRDLINNNDLIHHDALINCMAKAIIELADRCTELEMLPWNSTIEEQINARSVYSEAKEIE